MLLLNILRMENDASCITAMEMVRTIKKNGMMVVSSRGIKPLYINNSDMESILRVFAMNNRACRYDGIHKWYHTRNPCLNQYM
jgi:hypothetical protein